MLLLLYYYCLFNLLYTSVIYLCYNNLHFNYSCVDYTNTDQRGSCWQRRRGPFWQHNTKRFFAFLNKTGACTLNLISTHIIAYTTDLYIPVFPAFSPRTNENMAFRNSAMFLKKSVNLSFAFPTNVQ